MSLLQYMKQTSLENPEILVKDRRIEKLDKIVQEVKQSEEWEAVKMNILEIGVEKGKQEGMEKGADKKVVEQICKKLCRGKSEQCIAEEVEESLEKVAFICRLAGKYAPDYDYEKVYEEFCRNEV